MSNQSNQSNQSNKSNQSNQWPDRIPCLFGQGRPLDGIEYSSSHNLNNPECKKCSMILDPEYYISKKIKKNVDVFSECDENDLLFLNGITYEQLILATVSEKNEEEYRKIVRKYINFNK